MGTIGCFAGHLERSITGPPKAVANILVSIGESDPSIESYSAAKTTQPHGVGHGIRPVTFTRRFSLRRISGESNHAAKTTAASAMGDRTPQVAAPDHSEVHCERLYHPQSQYRNSQQLYRRVVHLNSNRIPTGHQEARWQGSTRLAGQGYYCRGAKI